MNSKLITRNIGRFLLLMALQVLVFNNIYLGGYINPCLYILFIAMLPTNTGRIPMMLIAFCTGMLIDIAANMPGFHAAACTLVAFLRGIWLDKIILRDNEEVIETPSIYNVAYQQFAIYLFLILFIFHLAYYLLLTFSFSEMPVVLLSSLLSTVITWILAILYQTLFFRKRLKADSMKN